MRIVKLGVFEYPFHQNLVKSLPFELWSQSRSVPGTSRFQYRLGVNRGVPRQYLLDSIIDLGISTFFLTDSSIHFPITCF